MYDLGASQPPLHLPESTLLLMPQTTSHAVYHTHSFTRASTTHRVTCHSNQWSRWVKTLPPYTTSTPTSTWSRILDPSKHTLAALIHQPTSHKHFLHEFQQASTSLPYTSLSQYRHTWQAGRTYHNPSTTRFPSYHPLPAHLESLIKKSIFHPELTLVWNQSIWNAFSTPTPTTTCTRTTYTPSKNTPTSLPPSPPLASLDWLPQQ